MHSTCHSKCHSSRYGMRHGTCIGKTMAEVEVEGEEEKRLRGWPISVVAVEGVARMIVDEKAKALTHARSTT